MNTAESRLILATMVAAAPELIHMFPSPRQKTARRVTDKDGERIAAAQAKRERKAEKRAAAAGKEA